ncbi:MAG: hypothetical protein CME32_07300 [Gimesia sp.]|nr:hypothetical protein [Gimesia sp.]
MIDLTVMFQGSEIRVKDIEIVGGLNSGIYARVVLAQNLVSIQVGDLFDISITYGTNQKIGMRLAVSRFHLPKEGAGGWIAMTDDVVSTQPSFDLEIFASREGVTPVEVIGSRIPLVQAPDSFKESKFLVVTVSDVTVAQMIEDFCARCGMFWWTDSEKLIISNEAADAVEMNGQLTYETETGMWMRSETWVPLASRVRSTEVELGVATGFRVGGTPAVLEVHLGEIPVATLASPKQVWKMPALIASTKPFEATLPSGRETEPELSASASLMIRESSKFRERLPLPPGTKLRVELYRGGVSTELPIAYVWSPGNAAEVYELIASEFQSQFDNFTANVKMDASITAQNIAQITGKQIHLNEYH